MKDGFSSACRFILQSTANLSYRINVVLIAKNIERKPKMCSFLTYNVLYICVYISMNKRFSFYLHEYPSVRFLIKRKEKLKELCKNNLLFTINFDVSLYRRILLIKALKCRKLIFIFDFDFGHATLASRQVQSLTLNFV